MEFQVSVVAVSSPLLQDTTLPYSHQSSIVATRAPASIALPLCLFVDPRPRERNPMHPVSRSMCPSRHRPSRVDHPLLKNHFHSFHLKVRSGAAAEQLHLVQDSSSAADSDSEPSPFQHPPPHAPRTRCCPRRSVDPFARQPEPSHFLLPCSTPC